MYMYKCMCYICNSNLLFTCGISICDVAGENRPTGAYVIIEFDLTEVATRILG